MKRYILLCLQPTPLVLVATFSAGLWLALQAGLMGLPLGFLLQSWFFKYCFVFLDSIVTGEDEPPVLSIEMVNPVSEQRPLALALMVVVEGMSLVWLQRHVGPTAAMFAGLALLWILPANIAILGITRNPLQALWPPLLLALISGLGRTYFALNGLMLVAATALYWIATHALSTWAALVAIQLLFLLTFALLGGAIFEHRMELGIDSKTRQERLAERDSREHAAERSRMLDRAYSRFHVRKPDEGWQEIQEWLQADRGTAESGFGEGPVLEYRAVLAAVSKWDDVRPADRLANELLAILLARRATGEALSVVEHRLATNPRFQVVPLPQAQRIVELAGVAGKRALQRSITVTSLPALSQLPKTEGDERRQD